MNLWLWAKRSHVLLSILWIGGTSLVGCAPLPDLQAEPEPHKDPVAQNQSTPADLIRYQVKPVPLVSSSSQHSNSFVIQQSNFDSQQTDPFELPALNQSQTKVETSTKTQNSAPVIIKGVGSSSSLVSSSPSTLPSFEDPHALPSFDDATPKSSPLKPSGSFVRTEIPERMKRNIRVGLSPKNKVKIICPDDCRVLIDGSPAGRLGPQLQAEIGSSKLILINSDGKRWVASEGLIWIEPWSEISDPIQVESKSYRGSIELFKQGNSIRIVNDLNTEDYLKGVVPGEIGRLDSSMFEALKAQSVAARTYAYRHFGSRQSQGFDVYDDVRDQVYDGIKGEHFLASDAIISTWGVVMQYKGQTIDAYYHSTCGGHTESLEAWNRPALPYLKAVHDLDSSGNAWCSLSSYSKWSFRYTWAELTRIVRTHLNSAQPDTVFSFNKIHKVLILDRLPGQRVGTVMYVTDRGTFKVRGDKNRWILRSPQSSEKTLPSAWFEIEQDNLGLTVSGKGFGHGIGMCQMGVRAKAKAGWEYKQILWSYYPDVDLVKWVPPN